MRTLGISLREGWHLDADVDDEADHIAFFEAGGMIVSLWAALSHQPIGNRGTL